MINKKVASVAAVCAVFAVVFSVWLATSTTGGSLAGFTKANGVLINGPANQAPPGVNLPGGRAPGFSLQRIALRGVDGATQSAVTLASSSGKPVVLDFLASWCIDCAGELPYLEKAFQTYGSQVSFIGVDWNDPPSQAVSFLNGLGVTFPVLIFHAEYFKLWPLKRTA